MSDEIRIFITGGSGFIGRHVCAALEKQNKNYAIYDTKEPEQKFREKFIKGNINNIKHLLSSVQDFSPTHFIHLAAFASVDSTDWSDFSTIWKGSENCINAFLRQPNPKRFVNISTQLVIGPDGDPEQRRAYAPYSTYGRAKMEAEIKLDEIVAKSKIELVHIRPCNIWGPFHPSYGKSILRYIEKGWYLHPKGRSIIRAYGYVENTAEQIIHFTLGNNFNVNGGIYYAADTLMPSGEFLDKLSQKLRRRPVRRMPQKALYALANFGQVLNNVGITFPFNHGRYYRTTTDYVTPLKDTIKICGQPTVDIDTGITEFVNWYKNLG